MRSKAGAILLAVLTVAAPARAEQAEPRTLAVPGNASWQHAETQMILPSSSAGLTRGEIRDGTDAELDVAAAYQSREEEITGTVYLYKTMTPDVPLWFDRALAAIMLRSEYGLAGAAAPATAGFARPGATTASGLRATIDLDAPNQRSTALAIAPLGGRFLLKIRLSSARLDRASLDERLTRFIQGLRWPAETRALSAAAPVAPCPSPLRLRTARIVQDDMTQTILNAVGGVAAANVDEVQGRRPVYCREQGATLEHAVYRPDAATDRYLIALGDSGNAIYVGRALDMSALMGDGRGRTRFSMTGMGREDSAVFPSFNRLPPPAQAMSVAFASRPSISVSTRKPGNE